MSRAHANAYHRSDGREILKQAYRMEYQNSFTDDATVVEAIGEKINLIEGEEANIKITFPTDLAFAEALFTAS